MIELKRGNLLEADAEALVNTVNCVGVMGKGIALQFKQAFPDNFREYYKAFRAGEVQPGKVLVVRRSLMNPKYIINFPTKRHWKGRAKLADIEAGLHSLTHEVEELGLKSVAVPPLGCGNGGLRWGQVKPIIERAFDKLPHVRVLLYEPAGAPEAEQMPVRTAKPKMTRARALLLKLLERYGMPGYRLTFLEVQKLGYLLQSAGEYLKLRFIKHRYGPYAEGLNHVLEPLEGHFIRGYGDRSQDAGIYLMPGASKEAEDVLAYDHQATEHLNRVSELIEGFETPYGMELLATVHWICQEFPEAASDVRIAVERVHEWSGRKRRVFSEHHVAIAWRRLAEKGWLQAA